MGILPLLLFTSLVIAGSSGYPSTNDLHSKFFQEENLEKHLSNDIGDLLTHYKSEAKLDKFLFGEHFRKNKKGKFHKKKSHAHLSKLLGHQGEQGDWRRGSDDLRFQDLSYKSRVPLDREFIPEAVRMTPNRTQDKGQKKKVEKKAAHIKKAHHLRKMMKLGKKSEAKNLWKWMNKRAKEENRRRFSSP